MSHVNNTSAPLLSRINWTNALFLVLSPTLVLIFLPIYLYQFGFDWRLGALLVIGSILTSVSITAGYHRLFAHRSYDTSLGLKIFYLIFGSAALQGSAIKWASDHRRHHRNVDQEEDPYQIQKGFFYAHMGWVFFKDDPKYLAERAKDLTQDKWILLQDKYNVPISIIVGFLVPTLIGLSFGSPWGGLLFGCLVRVVLTHHCTFFINSLCHMWGSQPYSDKNSARDSFILAFFTYGEGYHNFHHRFEADYRNGIKWYHWDPTKWWIKSLSLVGLAKSLRKVSDYEILKARLQMDELRLQALGRYSERFAELRLKIEESQKKFALFKRQYQERKRHLGAQGKEALAQAKIELRQAKAEFEFYLKQWQQIRHAPNAI